MKIATTTGDFARYCRNDEERIRELHRAGFRCIDLSMYTFKPKSEYMQEGWRDAVYRIKNLAEELEIVCYDFCSVPLVSALVVP